MLYQYTSGIPPIQRVLLTHYIIVQYHRLCKRLKCPADVAVSGLPLYHDMGLIGHWLGSLITAFPLVLMTHLVFKSSWRWLWAIHYHRGTYPVRQFCLWSLHQKIDEPCWSLGFYHGVCCKVCWKVYPRTLEIFISVFRLWVKRKLRCCPCMLAESTVALAIPEYRKWIRLIMLT